MEIHYGNRRILSHVLPEGASFSLLKAWLIGLEHDRESLYKKLYEKTDLARHDKYSLAEYDKAFGARLSESEVATYREKMARDLDEDTRDAKAVQSAIDEYTVVIKTYRDRLDRFAVPSEKRRDQEEEEERTMMLMMFYLCETVSTPEEVKAVQSKARDLCAEYDDKDRVGKCLSWNREIASRAISLLDKIFNKKDSLVKFLAEQSKGWNDKLYQI